MDRSQASHQAGDRPGVYVRFEMGVSWNPRQAPKNHQLTFASKSMRSRAKNFPRQLPPSNTNYLAAPYHHQHPSLGQQHDYQQQQQQQYYQQQQHYYQQQLQQQQQQQQQLQAAHYYSQSHEQPQQGRHRRQQQPQHQQHYQPAAATHYPQSHDPHPQAEPHPQAQPQSQRPSRSRSRSSHERGRSAPPPLNDSPWDAEPEPMMASALPRRSQQPQVWKALPATPSQYRLGEDGLPWSPSVYGPGYVEDGDVDSLPGPSTRHAEPARDPSAAPVDDRERGRVTEISSLATALMTVDNGFEDQWWYQGPRLVNIAGDLMSTAAMRELIANGGTVGWAVADPTSPSARASRGSAPESFRVSSPRSSRIDIVSPMSDCPSPASSFQVLRRSMTTRSDELHM